MVMMVDHPFVRDSSKVGSPALCRECPFSVQAHPNAKEVLEELLHEDDVHGWFGLTYAQYMTIPRSVLEAMPGEWQRRFVECLQELQETFDWLPAEGRYWVELRDASGRIRHDPLREYRHPNRIYLESIRRTATPSE